MLSQSRGPDWLESFRGETHDFVSASCLDGSDILADDGQIRVALACMLHAEMSDFIHNRICHWIPSINSSGEQISGQRYPAFSTACRMSIFLKGLLI